MAWTKEQEQAINLTGTNIIVSAGAGSGKTAVLTARTMRILNSKTHINELLILTFTSSAAAEMKERIRKKIKEEIPKNPELTHELELLDQSYITTFDSFALSIVKKYHYLLNISNNIGISDASVIELQKNKILDEVFDEFYNSDNKSFQKLIYDFCLKDDQDLKKLILKIATKIDGKPDRDEYLSNYIDNYFSPVYINDCLNEYLSILKEHIAEIKDLAYELSLLTDADYNTKLEESLSYLYHSSTIDAIYQVISNIKLPTLPRGSEEEVKNSRDNLKKALDKLKTNVLTYGPKSTLTETINLTKDYIAIIIDIITAFLKHLHKYKEDNEIYDFQDIALLSIRILKEYPQVREELTNSFKEIMIDEYQDTNDIQETFISMIANNNVYMVGDIKQSIYRFRNANPYIFKNKYDNYSNNNGGIKIDLVKNFRSRREVLDNINTIFNLIMDDEIGGADYIASHQMVFGNTSYIEEGLTDYNYNFKILEYNPPEDHSFSKEEIEIFTIAKDIKDKINNHYQVFDKDKKVLRDITYTDFVILMDRTSDFDLYKKIFEYVGIPLSLFKDETLNNSNDIYILKNIINYLIKINKKEFDIEYKYSFVSIARSFLYRLPDDEIFACFKNNNFKDNIIYQTLSPLSKDISSSSITELLYKIIDCTNMYEKFITIGDINSSIIRLSNLLDIASNLSELGYDIYTFEKYLDDLLDKDYSLKYKVSNKNSNAVRIMTIHTSKGLEYHICYYSGLYKKFNISDLNERFSIDNKFGIISPYFKEGINESWLKYLVRYNYLTEEVSEKIRLFYVALTRAKEKIVLLNPLPKKETNFSHLSTHLRRSYRSFSDIINSIKPNLSKYYVKVDLNSLNLSKNYLYKINNKSLEITTKDKLIINELPAPNLSIKNEENFHKNLHELITEETSNNIDLGLKIHEYLEYIDFKNPEYHLIKEPLIKESIKNFLNQSILNNIKEANIYKEYEFIYQDANNEYHGIIDLMVEYKDHIDIIDYKLNNVKDEKYLKQLNGYKEYIKKISNKKINIYLYSILSNTLVEL